ncbi:MAG: hypothetical protein R2693_03215 [Nocardioidaceae bacterium]
MCRASEPGTALERNSSAPWRRPATTTAHQPGAEDLCDHRPDRRACDAEVEAGEDLKTDQRTALRMLPTTAT